jgi:hypothetical protein
MQSGLNPRLPDSAEKPDDADFIAADDVKTAEEIQTDERTKLIFPDREFRDVHCLSPPMRPRISNFKNSESDERTTVVLSSMAFL